MKSLSIQTQTRTQFLDITAQVQEHVAGSSSLNGVVTVFVPHTTAGVTINENADPDVVADIESTLDQLIPWRNNYKHSEGNSAAHVKASLMGSSVQVPIADGKLMLGVWQSIYFCEFDGPRDRKVWVT